ncbi:ISAzo13 family transposase [Pirellulaceae bacterium SH467]
MTERNVVEWIRSKYTDMCASLNERSRRLWCAVEARAIGYGGIVTVAEATGISERTIRRGLAELERGVEVQPGRQRKKGGGRPTIEQRQPGIRAAIEKIVSPSTRGDPMGPLLWTCKSTRSIATEMQRIGFSITAPTVGKELHAAGYSLQANRKTREGEDHPDRDEQFQYINRRAKAFQRSAQPVVSVDTKKKEILGKKKNAGQTWRPSGQPLAVDTHDFPDAAKGKAVPYGVYDITTNEAVVNVGINHDTAQFAVASIELWWRRLGKKRHKNSTRLMITADSGGSNGARNRLWKYELQRLANKTNLEIEVCHFPPGTSKWNKIEHRVFCHITSNWRGTPLETYEVIVQLIGSTTTAKGLEIHAFLDQREYEKALKITDQQMADINIFQAKFHGDWNYTIKPNKKD